MDFQPYFNSGLRKLLTVFAVALTGVAMTAVARAEPHVKVSGHVQYSFRPGHYVLVNKEGTLYIRSDSLGVTEFERFEKAVTATSLLTADVPERSIEFFEYEDTGARSSKVQSHFASREGFWVHDRAYAHLEGTQQLSWEQSGLIIQAEDKIYQIRRQWLSTGQLERIEAAGIGSHVSLELPLPAVELAWTLPGEEREAPPATNSLSDAIQFDMNRITITGSVLLSWSETVSMVQSKDVIARFANEEVDEATRRQLESPGSRVSVTVSLSALQDIWSTRMGKSLSMDGLAGQLP